MPESFVSPVWLGVFVNPKYRCVVQKIQSFKFGDEVLWFVSHDYRVVEKIGNYLLSCEGLEISVSDSPLIILNYKNISD